MASGSYFLILKETDESLKDESVKELIHGYAKELDFWNNCENVEELIPNLQKTQPVKLDEYCESDEYFSISTGRIYKCLVKVDFLSDFTELKDYFEMNPYSKSGEIEISVFDAYKMLEVLNYIKNPDLWSHTVETNLLDKNEYLHVFDCISSKFYSRFETDGCSQEPFNYILHRLIEVLNTFFTINNSSEHIIKLVYKTW